MDIKNSSRPDWDQYFMELAKTVAQRATCNRGKCGAVAVLDKRVLATGYVGAPKGLPHCDEVGHLLKKVTHEDGHESEHCMRTVHAEQNLICQAAAFGVALNGCSVYTKMTPCRACAMLLVNAGVARIVCDKKYQQSGESEELLAQAGVKVEFLSQEVEKY